MQCRCWRDRHRHLRLRYWNRLLLVRLLVHCGGFDARLVVAFAVVAQKYEEENIEGHRWRRYAQGLAVMECLVE